MRINGLEIYNDFDTTGVTNITGFTETISSGSTDYELPTAKSVYDIVNTAGTLQDLESVLSSGNTTEGNNIKISDNDIIEFYSNADDDWGSFGFNQSVEFYELIHPDGDYGRIKLNEIYFSDGTWNTDLTQTATAMRTIYLPDASGTIELEENRLFEVGGGAQSIQSINISNPNDASGSYSAIVGGKSNVDIGTECNFIGGGSSNNIELSSGTYVRHNAIGAGYNNEILDGSYSFIGGGRDNNIVGSFSGSINSMWCDITTDHGAVINCSYSSVSGSFSTAIGIGNSTLDLKLDGDASYNFSHQASTTIQYGNSGYTSAIIGGTNHHIHGGASNFIGGGSTNYIGTDANWDNGIVGGANNIIEEDGKYNFIGGGESNVIDTGITNSVILGGSSITANHDNMVYVPNLKIVPGAAPSTPERGMIYYDQFDDTMKVWNGTIWKDLY